MKILLPLSLIFILTNGIPLKSESRLHSRSSNLPEYRLPTNIRPIHYDLYLKTYLPGYSWKEDEKSLTFEGVLEIKLNVTEATDRIVLHSESLEVIDANLRTAPCTNVSVTSWNTTQSLQFLTIYLSDFLQPSTESVLFLVFKGKLGTRWAGYFSTPSTRSNGENMVNAVTQFEATDARRMVPCFDEPELKATWQLVLEHPIGSTALTNAIETGTEANGDEFAITTFEKTVRMSSYLLAVFVGDLEFKETYTDKGLRIRVYTDPANIDKIDHALNVSRITVEGFEKQFGVDYPMKKLDFVSAENFFNGAMENWGLIVHHQMALFGNSEDSVTATVIHELAHQWFGNLVTMKFWDETWLNEGFASYMTGYGFANLEPGFDRDFFYTQHAQLSVFKLTKEHPPIVGLVRDENGAIDISGWLYTKGSAFIGMIEKIIGAEAFNSGIRDYLSKFQYQNVHVEDLYDSLSTYISADLLGPDGNTFDLHNFAKCWTHQRGYPTISINKIGSRESISQHNEEFGEYNNQTECGNKWDVPIWYQEAGSEEVKLIWLSRNVESLEVDWVTRPPFLNANSNGFYKVDKKDFTDAIEALESNPSFYSDSTKLRLLTDVGERFNDLDAHQMVRLVKVLKAESNSFTQLQLQALALGVRIKLEENIKKEQEDLQALEEAMQSTGHSSFIENCEKSENFLECMLNIKTKEEVDLVCLEARLRQELNMTEALIGVLKTDKSPIRRLTASLYLICADKARFLSIYKNPEYNWTETEIKFLDRELGGNAPSSSKIMQRGLVGHPLDYGFKRFPSLELDLITLINH